MKYKLEVEPFSHDFMRSQGDKALALKPLEEAAEAFGAWQRYEGDEWDVTDDELEIMLLNDIADELADTVQACVNLADFMGFDLSAALSRVHERNAERGRHEVRDGCEEVRTCCEEGAEPSTDEAERVASALRALEAPDWPSLTKAVLGRNGTRREVVGKLADLLDGAAGTWCVRDCDGVPIAVGDTVRAKRDGRRWTVVGFDFSKQHSVIAVDGRCAKKELKPAWLTHAEPDSWERLDGDAVKGACEYFGFLGKPCNDGDGCSANKPGDCAKFKALDIIRRAKALAGVEVAE